MQDNWLRPEDYRYLGRAFTLREIKRLEREAMRDASTGRTGYDAWVSSHGGAGAGAGAGAGSGGSKTRRNPGAMVRGVDWWWRFKD